jgi:hypothetical protein
MPKSEYAAYSGAQSQCAYDEAKAVVKNTGMVQERYLSNDRLKSIVAKQPVSSGMVVSEIFRLYQGGILVEGALQCSDAKKAINHQVTIVGYGKSSKQMIEGTWCDQYWLV